MKIEESINLGSHNTFTYLKPRKWYHYFCIPFARCQTKNIREQIKSGIRSFDIRVRFDDNGDIYLCHGLFEVKFNTCTNISKYPQFVDWLICEIVTGLLSDSNNGEIDDNEKITFRLVLETSKVNDIQEMWFKNFCKYFDEKLQEYKNFNIASCTRKFDWKELYSCKYLIKEFQHISSYPKYKESIKVRWYEKICPWLYAKRTNVKFLENYKNDMYKNYTDVYYDFI